MKKLQLKKDVIQRLDMSKIRGGDGGPKDEITTNPTTKFTNDGICYTIETAASAALGTWCTGVTVVTLTAKACPTAKTDCDTCMCYSRWCI